MLITPDELDLLSFFESEPIESTPEDGYFCYKQTDANGIDFYFSFHEIERSIQVRLSLLGKDLVIFSEECAEKITIEKDGTGEYLACTFKLGEAESKAKIHVRPEIKVLWHTLQI